MQVSQNSGPNFTSVMPIVIMHNGVRVTDSNVKTAVVKKLSKILNGSVTNVRELEISDKFSKVDKDVRDAKIVKLRTIKNYLLTGKHAEIIEKEGKFIGKGKKAISDASVVDADRFVDTRLGDAMSTMKRISTNFYNAVQNILLPVNRLRNEKGRLLNLVVDISKYGKNNNKINLDRVNFEEIIPKVHTQLSLF